MSCSFPWPEDYDSGNILFRRSSNGKRGRGRPRKQEPIVGYMGTAYDGYPAGQQGSPYLPGGLQQQQHPPQHNQYRQQPTGARLKVMRCVQLKAPESKRALLDFGLGVGVDLDRQVRDILVWMCHGTREQPSCCHPRA